MRNGIIDETGTFNELMEHNGSFAEFCREYLEQSELQKAEDTESVVSEKETSYGNSLGYVGERTRSNSRRHSAHSKLSKTAEHYIKDEESNILKLHFLSKFLYINFFTSRKCYLKISNKYLNCS